MTTTVAREVSKRKSAKGERPDTFSDDLRVALLSDLEAQHQIRFPSTRYRKDPVAFFREILGVEPWSKQVEILEAIRDHKRVAIRSGHKVSKSNSAAGIALWYWCSFEDARVVMTSTTSRQVDQILWRELRMMRARGGRCLTCKSADPDGRRIARPCPHSAIIEGDCGELARTGLKSEDFREVVGFTAREAEAVAGVSGKNLLYIVDEASGVPDEIYEAIEGNRAGGARIVLFGNPTRTTGEHFEAFYSKKHLYKGITVSSEETPNVVEGREVIPGLATREWIEEKKLEWGEESAQYKVRVKGEHALAEDGKIFSLHTITQAEQRWHETPEAGRLFVGIDPAGPTGTGDETAMASRRGLRMMSLQVHLGLDEAGIEAQLLDLLATSALPRELPVVVVDRSGPIGTALYSRLLLLAQGKRPRFELVGLIAGARAVRRPHVYGAVRDELVANLAGWMRDGGAILEDAKLSAEMHEYEWVEQVNGRLKVTNKDDIRKKLKRSPDRFDALCLAAWEPLSLGDDERDDAPQATIPASQPAARSAPARASDEDDDVPASSMDPYGGSSAWGGRR